MEALKKKPWWDYLGTDLQDLLNQSFLLVDVLEGMGADLSGGRKEFYDYSFVVFPAAKAYEGFLKKLLLSKGFITEEDYYGKHFRIGKALNPSLPKDLRRESVYGKIVASTGDNKLADKLWETWKLGRNLVFHWFPNEKNAITLTESKERIAMIVEAIDQACKVCNIE
jgi:hypothetical protein